MPSDPAGEADRPPSLWGRLRDAIRPQAAVDDAERPANEDPKLHAARLARLENVEAFEKLRVEDVMVPRVDIIGLEVNAPLGEVLKTFAEAQHSRLPIYRENLDDPIGVAHIKDVIRQVLPENVNGAPTEERKVLDAIKRPALFVPPSMPAADLLLKMQGRRIQMALVVDEYGGTDGLVTIADLIQEIIGEIEDEHSNAAAAVRMRGAQIWDADARASIEDLEALVGRKLQLPDMVEEVDTLGGLAFALAGRVPERGEVLCHPEGFEFEVVEADPRRIRRLVVRAVEPGEPEAAPATDAGAHEARNTDGEGLERG